MHGMATLRFRRAAAGDLPAVVGILAVAGEHMHRVQQMSHWYPFPSLEQYVKRAEGRDVYLVEEGDLAVATFDLSTVPEGYHDMAEWPDGAVPAIYFGGFGVLPSHWGRGIGAAVVAEAERLARASGSRHFRFDAVSSNEILVEWYRSLGFDVTGSIDLGRVAVTCFEKLLEG